MIHSFIRSMISAKNFLFFVSCALTLCVSAHKAADAGAVFAETTCDPLYYDSMEARAWLEAQREITQNQNLIFKPDSVLAYTCFDSQLNHLAKAVIETPLFSQTDRWGPPAGDIIKALEPVDGSLKSYIDFNFAHSFLGGRLEPPLVHEVVPGVTAADYTCDIMNLVWEQAKCMDFIHQPEHDGFYSFLEYDEADDMRWLPVACVKAVDFGEQIEIAVVDEVTEWEEDLSLAKIEFFVSPAWNCGNDLLPPARVSTGITVERSEGLSGYQEYACLIPGCFYDGGECVAASMQ